MDSNVQFRARSNGFVGSSELGPIYRRTGHSSSYRPRHTDRLVGRPSEESPLTARIRRLQTAAALSAVRAHRGTEGSNSFPSSGESANHQSLRGCRHLADEAPPVDQRCKSFEPRASVGGRGRTSLDRVARLRLAATHTPSAKEMISPCQQRTT